MNEPACIKKRGPHYAGLLYQAIELSSSSREDLVSGVGKFSNQSEQR
jgi:hypothetical protein